jgi:hypothetical protein
MKSFIGIALVFIVVFAVISGIFSVVGWLTKASKVVEKEVDPANLQRKYEWFKDQSAALTQLNADIKVYYTNVSEMKSDYKGIHRSKWTRDDRNQYAQWRAECAGVVAKYNELAAEYNSQMAKWNWKFCNVGSLPKGASEVLPKAYAPYKTDLE